MEDSDDNQQSYPNQPQDSSCKILMFTQNKPNLPRRLFMSRRKTKTSNVCDLAEALVNNGYAKNEGPTKRRSWTKHDLCSVRPLTDNQADMFQSFFQGQHIVACGSTGTGKTFIALWLALNEILNPQTKQEKLLIVRSNVPTREIGHLPGTFEEKLSPYERPYYDMLGELFGKYSTYDNMKKAGLIEFMSTSFIRGQTWNDCIVIVDESQSMNFHEFNSVVTRIGENTRLIILGDTKQDDLIYKKNDMSGFAKALRAFQHMPNIGMIQFTSDDIIRDKFVRDWIIACEIIES